MLLTPFSLPLIFLNRLLAAVPHLAPSGIRWKLCSLVLPVRALVAVVVEAVPPGPTPPSGCLRPTRCAAALHASCCQGCAVARAVRTSPLRRGHCRDPCWRLCARLCGGSR